jgi:hypothetical protein
MKRKVLSSLILVLLLGLLLPTTAFAAGNSDGRVIFGDSFTLETGQVQEGDIIVLGGNVDLKQGSTVNGSILVLGGNVTAAGEVTGDVSVLGGNAELTSTAHIRGDVSSVGGNLRRDPGAQVDGQVTRGQGLDLPFNFRFGPSIVQPMAPSWSMRLSPLFVLIWFGFRVLVLAALAVLVVIFWPDPSLRVAHAAVAQPFGAAGLGCLTLIIGLPALVLLLLTVLLSPLSLLGMLLLVVAGVFGWIALGLEVGRRLALAFGWDIHPSAQAGIGGLLLTLVVGGVGLLPCIGIVIAIAVVCLGLGAVMLTRFGSRDYMPGVALAEPEPPKAAPSRRRSSSTKKS